MKVLVDGGTRRTVGHPLADARSMAPMECRRSPGAAPSSSLTRWTYRAKWSRFTIRLTRPHPTHSCVGPRRLPATMAAPPMGRPAWNDARPCYYRNTLDMFR
jgi:hypothetical protein